MCGRFVLHETIEALSRSFPIDKAACEVNPNYNVAPTQTVPVIYQDERINILDRFHWGLVPFWAKDTKIGSSLINARAETVETKPAFRAAFKRRRCLIPASGFYEWKGTKGNKQPMYITLPTFEPFAFAGLWETWDKEVETYRSCTIITTLSSESIRDIHSRMPVILTPDSYKAWLDQGIQDKDVIKGILQEGMMTELSRRPVSTRVNNVRFNDPSNIEVIEEADNTTENDSDVAGVREKQKLEWLNQRLS